MPLAETVSNLFRQKKESSHPRKVWDYDHFKDYLLLLSGGPEFVLPYGQYPERIRLSKPWHEALNQMREESQDGNERFGLICYRNGLRSLYLPRVTAIGHNHDVPNEIILAELEKANRATMNIVGVIHSHPNSKVAFHDFSRRDLYNLLVPSFHIKAVGLAETDRNFFAFSSRETEMVPSNLGFTYNQFQAYWDKKAPRPRDMNTALGQRHKLVIYSGKPNGELVRKTK